MAELSLNGLRKRATEAVSLHEDELLRHKRNLEGLQSAAGEVGLHRQLGEITTVLQLITFELECRADEVTVPDVIGDAEAATLEV